MKKEKIQKLNQRWKSAKSKEMWCAHLDIFGDCIIIEMQIKEKKADNRENRQIKIAREQ